MSKKTMAVLGAAAVAVVALVLWQRSKMRAAAAAAGGYDPPPPMTTAARVAASFSNLAENVGNWAAQWVTAGAQRVGGTIVQNLPVPMGAKDPSSATADPRQAGLVTKPQPYN